MRYPLFFLSLISLVSYTPLVRAFSVSISSSPTQCGPLSVQWTGGQPPFEIMLIPAYNVPRNISVPPSAFSNNQGSYQIPSIPFDQGKSFLFTMSDASGFGTGGTSGLLTMGAPVGGASCNTTPPALPFYFNLPSALQQCSPYVFQYDGAVMPVTIMGLIPDGTPFLLHPPSGPTSYMWTANVPAGTTIIFTMTDAQGNSGGASDAQVVALSTINSCIDGTSPSSTASVFPSLTSSTSSTSASTGTTTTTTTASPTHTSSSISTRAIGGIVAGGVAFAAIAALALFCIRRRRYNRQSYGIAPTRGRQSVDLDPAVDNFEHPPIYPFPYQADSVSQLTPPMLPDTATGSSFHYQTDTVSQFAGSATGSAPLQQHSRSGSNSEFGGLGEATTSTMSSSGRRKAEMAGMRPYQPTTRFVVHTDAEDSVPVAEEEVVELPPQYSARRAPAAARPMSSATSTNLPYASDHPPESPLI